jgi:hypothetical protein
LLDFLTRAAARHLAFKATAGLHHPLRAPHPLTYEAASPCAVMHGFLNLFAAAAFIWHGAEPDSVLGILEETDPGAIEFTPGGLQWRGSGLSTAQIRDARASFVHSFGSCSFEEPVAGLRKLGLLS